MFYLPVRARSVVLTVAFQIATGAVAWAQVPHIPSVIGSPGMHALSGSAEAAALAHYLQMLKHFDQNGNGVLDPTELSLAKSGLGSLLGPAANGPNAAGHNGAASLLPMFDRNGNGQLDTVEMQLVQMMMAMLIANYSRPVSGVPLAMPVQAPPVQASPPAKQGKRVRKKRAERIADFAKMNNQAGAPKPPAAAAKKKVKARAPMVERDQPQAVKGPVAAKAKAANAAENE